jgi:hypothetical protein
VFAGWRLGGGCCRPALGAWFLGELRVAPGLLRCARGFMLSPTLWAGGLGRAYSPCGWWGEGVILGLCPRLVLGRAVGPLGVGKGVGGVDTRLRGYDGES